MSSAGTTHHIDPTSRVAVGLSEVTTVDSHIPEGTALRLYESISNDTAHLNAKRAAERRASPAPTAAASRGGGGLTMHRRPLFLLCYLCGQQFSKGSLGIHQPQCYVKKLLEWERGGENGVRGPKPLHPDEARDRLDAAAPCNRQQGKSMVDMQYALFEETALVGCEHCGRTFLPDRLVVHQRSCKPGSAAKPAPQRRSASPPHPLQSTVSMSQPVTLTDTDCANDKNTNGHHRVGIDRFAVTHNGEAEELRTASPPLGRSLQVLEKRVPLSDPASVSSASTLLRCRYCQRTFAEDRIERHEGACVERKKPPPHRIGTPPPTTTMALVSTSTVKASAHHGSGSQTARGCRVTSPTPVVLPRQSSGVRVSALATTSRDGDLGRIRPLLGVKEPEGGGSRSPQRAAVASQPQSKASLASMDGLAGGTLRQSPEASAWESQPRVTSGGGGPPPVSIPAPIAIMDGDSRQHPQQRRFCTECGTRLLYATQKFCGECGTPVV